MRHRWDSKTTTGNDKCSKCGLIRVLENVVKQKDGTVRHIYSWKRGNKWVGEGILEDRMPKCKPKG